MDKSNKSVIETNKHNQSESHDNKNKKIKKLDKSNKSVIETDKQIQSKFHNNKNEKEVIMNLRRSDRNKHKPYISYEEINYLMCAQSIVCKVPSSLHEIKYRDDRKQWEQAIKEEIDSLLINNTWTFMSKPVNKNIVDCKWVFAIKNDEFGNPIKYKARLVARGFSQEYLMDYNETFAPVARISSFRFTIAFANQFNLLIHHMDVKTAFLNGILKEEMYMRVPNGVKCNAYQVCKLNKALYGLTGSKMLV